MSADQGLNKHWLLGDLGDHTALHWTTLAFSYVHQSYAGNWRWLFTWHAIVERKCASNSHPLSCFGGSSKEVTERGAHPWLQNKDVFSPFEQQNHRSIAKRTSHLWVPYHHFHSVSVVTQFYPSTRTTSRLLFTWITYPEIKEKRQAESFSSCHVPLNHF